MKKILHTASYSGKPLEILYNSVPKGFIVETLKDLSYDSLIKQASDADYFLVSGRLKINNEILRKAPHLKMIQRTGVGIEMLDLDEIKRRNIPIYVNKAINARSVAEHTIALIFACLKNIVKNSNAMNQGIWEKQESGLLSNELYGKNVGIVGMGAIGKMVASYLNVFGVNIAYTDIKRTDYDFEKKLNLKFFPNIKSLLNDVDILTLHCPLTNETNELINSKSLAWCKPNTIIINTARGKLINPYDLAVAVREGKIKRAALDVHYEEPLPKNYPLKNLENVILTPHIGGLSYETFSLMINAAMQNILLYDKGDYEAIKLNRLS